MKNDPNEIHFDCPKCKRPMSGDKALLGEMINCPDCNEPFIPTPRKPEPALEPAKPEIQFQCRRCFHIFESRKTLPNVTCPNCGGTICQAFGGWEIKNVVHNTQAEKIHNQANRFTVVSGCFCVIGLFVAIAALAQAISGEEGASSMFIVASSLIGVSLWFYLVAQIVHIRANTEKQQGQPGKIAPRFNYSVFDPRRATLTSGAESQRQNPRSRAAQRWTKSRLAIDNACGKRDIWLVMRSPQRAAKKLDYPEETSGSRLAAKARKLASKLTPEQRREHFNGAMAMIYGGAKEATLARR